jgi:hypothetical protein
LILHNATPALNATNAPSRYRKGYIFLKSKRPMA